MKLIAGGIGIGRVMISSTGLALTGNETFFEKYQGVMPGTPRLGLHHIEQNPDGTWDLHLREGALPSSAVHRSGGVYRWRVMWSRCSAVPEGIPHGVTTHIVALRRGADDTIIITIPKTLEYSGKVNAVHKKSTSRPEPAAPVADLAALQHAVRAVNAAKAAMGEDLVLSIDNGRLLALMSIG